MDKGLSRRLAVRVVGTATCVGGLPSAISTSIFDNQDWVWGLALMISGLFVALGVAAFGVERFRNELTVTTETAKPTRVATVFCYLLVYLVPVQFVAVFGWWVFQAVTVYDPEAWWNPARVFSLGTCLLQWGVAIGLLLIFNNRLASAGSNVDEAQAL